MRRSASDQQHVASDPHHPAGAINLRVISDHWFELLRLALSIKTGTVTASVILRKLAAYPRQNGLALALRELGKLERTFFTSE